MLAGEHGLDPLGKTCALGEGDEQAKGLGSDAVLRIIEMQVGGVERHGVAARWFVGEELTQVPAPDLVAMGAQGRPLGRGVDRVGHAPRCSTSALA